MSSIMLKKLVSFFVCFIEVYKAHEVLFKSPQQGRVHDLPIMRLEHTDRELLKSKLLDPFKNLIT